MNLIIDIGNTLCKLAVADGDKFIEIYRVASLDVSSIEKIVEKHGKIKKVVLATVRKQDNDLEFYLKENSDYFLKVTHQTSIPIKNLYSTPETLGIDRLMCAVGGASLFPNKELLLFDLGSAITIDNVSCKGEFIGGNISPGLNMRFRALHTFTEKLPLCNADNDFSIAGQNTEQAIKGGVIVGIIKEIEGYINDYLIKNKEIVIIFTGGDAKYFVFKVKNTIFVDCDLLLKGLNKVLEYNYDKN